MELHATPAEPAPEAPLPADVPPAEAVRRRPRPDERVMALLEVVLCSDFPTLVALSLLFSRLGFSPLDPSGAFRIRFFAPLLLTDTVVLVGLVVLLLKAHGERPATVLFGGRDWRTEIRAAVPMIFGAYGIAIAIMLLIAAVAPSLHTVTRNPLQDLLRAPKDAALFALVVIVAGGLREEVQRAFILTRFERALGGAWVGVVVASAAFGAGHLDQGRDAAVATALLGAYWGMAYLRRRSIIAPVISHAAFDLLQIGVFVVAAR